MFGYPVLISIDFDYLTSPFTVKFLFRVKRHINHSRQCFIGYPNTSNFVKNTPLRVVFSSLFSVSGYFGETLFLVFDILHHTRETVFPRDNQTPRRKLKMRPQRSSFDENRAVWGADKTPFQVFLIYLLDRKKGVYGKVKSSKSIVIKAGSSNLLHGYDFLGYNLINY